MVLAYTINSKLQFVAQRVALMDFCIVGMSVSIYALELAYAYMVIAKEKERPQAFLLPTWNARWQTSWQQRLRCRYMPMTLSIL